MSKIKSLLIIYSRVMHQNLLVLTFLRHLHVLIFKIIQLSAEIDQLIFFVQNENKTGLNSLFRSYPVAPVTNRPGSLSTYPPNRIANASMPDRSPLPYTPDKESSLRSLPDVSIVYAKRFSMKISKFKLVIVTITNLNFEIF